jgi:hypothetical protein
MRSPALSALAFLGSGMDRHLGDGSVLLLELVGPQDSDVRRQ